jgi:hypothetical protein
VDRSGFYLFKGKRLCDDHAREIGIAGALECGSSYMWGDCGTAEDTLGEWASMLGLDRDDADSDEFPVPIDIETARSEHVSCAKCGYTFSEDEW